MKKKNADDLIANLLQDQNFITRDQMDFVSSRRLLKSLKGSRSRLQGQSLVKVWEDYTKHKKNEIELHDCAEIMKNFEVSISNNIKKYFTDTQSCEIFEIALAITAWGGASGFRQSLGTKGFLNPSNFSSIAQHYINLANSIVLFNEQYDEKNFNEIHSSANRLFGLGVSFGTKHMKFWSDDNLPVWDNRIAINYFNCMPNWENYNEYLDYMQKQSEIYKIQIGQLERLMFNYLDYKGF